MHPAQWRLHGSTSCRIDMQIWWLVPTVNNLFHSPWSIGLFLLSIPIHLTLRFTTNAPTTGCTKWPVRQCTLRRILKSQIGHERPEISPKDLYLLVFVCFGKRFSGGARGFLRFLAGKNIYGREFKCNFFEWTVSMSVESRSSWAVSLRKTDAGEPSNARRQAENIPVWRIFDYYLGLKLSSKISNKLKTS